MDTWSIAKITLDAIFAVTIAGVIAGFLYYREKRLNATLSETLTRTLDLGLPSQPRSEIKAYQSDPRAAAVNRLPDFIQTKSEKTSINTQPAKPRVNRAEKYLEAVRMYRQGSDPEEIERNLGISFMELELLGKIQ